LEVVPVFLIGVGVTFFFLLVFLYFLLPVDQYFEQIAENLNTFLDFPFHQVSNSLCEISVQAQPFGCKVVVGGALQVLMRSINIFLL